ncbi:MAG: hypothetical protein ACI9VR_000034 [Cognaticolwellia sp.]|jgi:hypothetical protein
MTESTGEALLSTPAPFGKIRGILVAMAVFWALMSLVTVYGNTQLSAEDLGDTPLWATVAAPAFVGLFSALAAWRTRPGDRQGWGLGVSAMALNLLGCVTAPLAIWGILMLFKPTTKAQMLGGRFAKPLPQRGLAATPPEPKQTD